MKKNEATKALEALEVLDKIISPLLEPVLAEYEDDLSDKITANYFALKQFLLKAQEPKKYLKWEDLEFSEELKVLNVRMNNNDYILRYALDIFGDNCCFLYDSTRNHHIYLIRQFFNDLHLERVGE